MKTTTIRIGKRELAIMRKFFKKKRGETNPEYLRRYLEEMPVAEMQENFCN